jgi:hypothetical protein
MPRRVLTVELQDIVPRLRLGHSVKAIHRETGRHKTVIRAVRDLAGREGWLSPTTELPSEGEISLLYEETGHDASHPLKPYEAQIKDWLRAKYSFQVIHKLLEDMGVGVSESTVRRWIHRRLPHLPSPVILRATKAGEVMEVDFGYLGTFWDPLGGKLRKVWFFSGRRVQEKHGNGPVTADWSPGAPPFVEQESEPSYPLQFCSGQLRPNERCLARTGLGNGLSHGQRQQAALQPPARQGQLRKADEIAFIDGAMDAA